MAKKKEKLSLWFRFKKLSPQRRYIISSLVFLLAAAFVVTWFFEYRYFVNEMSPSWEFVFGRPRVFLYNSLLVYLALLALWAIGGRPAIAPCVLWIAGIIIGYIHINKVSTRSYPLLPEDFQLAGSAGSLAKFIDFWQFTKLVLACLIVVFITTLFIIKVEKRLYLRPPHGSRRFARRHMLGFRSILLSVSLLVFMNATEFVRHNSGERYEDISFLKTTFTAWNQTRNYDENGFIVGFLYNLQKLQLGQPEDYSEEYMATLNAYYSTIAETRNMKRIDPLDEDVSVVVILNESFFDPSVEWKGRKFEDFYPYSGGDITPNLHKIQQKYPSGYMYSTDYGGGTANIEFEALTGLSNYWLNTVPYTAIIPKLNYAPSLANMLKNDNYATTAIHPFNGGMYKRNISLKKEGFDNFITEMELDYKEHEGKSEYINDQSAYRQTIDALKSGPDKQMITLITMQNHTPYYSWIYDDPKFEITDKEIDEELRGNIATYYQSLHNSDAYLGEFIEELESMDKKVVVLFFGDHSAGIFDNVNDDPEKDVRDMVRLTPYFIYANYDAGLTQNELPTTTPNCMSNTLLNNLNWQKTSRYYLLDEVCAESPILTQTYFDENDYIETEVLHKYQLYIYDQMSGSAYWKE